MSQPGVVCRPPEFGLDLDRATSAPYRRCGRTGRAIGEQRPAAPAIRHTGKPGSARSESRPRTVMRVRRVAGPAPMEMDWSWSHSATAQVAPPSVMRGTIRIAFGPAPASADASATDGTANAAFGVRRGGLHVPRLCAERLARQEGQGEDPARASRPHQGRVHSVLSVSVKDRASDVESERHSREGGIHGSVFAMPHHGLPPSRE